MRIFNRFLPKEELTFLVSGGVDSIAGCHWLKTAYRQQINILHFNHKCQHINDKMEQQVKAFAAFLGVQIRVITRLPDSPFDCTEAGLREFRLSELAKIGGRYCTGHHLGDATESYIQNMLRGCPEYKPIQEKTKFQNFTIFHPFLLTTKQDMIDYIQQHDLQQFVVEDPTNNETKNQRNWIRNIILPEIKTRTNLETTVRKKFYNA